VEAEVGPAVLEWVCQEGPAALGRVRRALRAGLEAQPEWVSVQSQVLRAVLRAALREMREAPSADAQSAVFKSQAATR
jgi:hypothetical protein